MPQHWLANPQDPEQILVPLQHQQDFRDNTSEKCFLAGGYGASKSTALVQWLAMRAMKNPPNTVGGVILPTAKLTAKFLENHLIPAFKNLTVGHSISKTTLYLRGGRQLVYLSGHKPETIEGHTFCYCGMDEAGLMSKKVFTHAAARVRDKRSVGLQVGITGTPVWGWLKDAFDGRNDSQRRIMRISTDDNPHLHKDYLGSLLDAMPKRLENCLRHGFFVPPGGSCYPEIDPEVHQIDFGFDRRFETGVAIDFASRTPALLFFQLIPPTWRIIDGKILPPADRYRADKHTLPINGQGACVLFDEINPDGSVVGITTEQLCRLIVAKAYPLSYVLPDPAGKAEQSSSGTNDIAIVQGFMHRGAIGGRMMMKKSAAMRFIPTGVDHVKRMLAPVTGPPMLYFKKELCESKDPRSVWNALNAYGYGAEDKDGPISQVPIKDGISDHQSDLTRYIAINLFPVIRLAARVRSLK